MSGDTDGDPRLLRPLLNGALPRFLGPNEVVQRIKALENETRLLVVDKETDEYLRSLRITCAEAMEQGDSLGNPPRSPANSTSGNPPKSPSNSISENSPISPNSMLGNSSTSPLNSTLGNSTTSLSSSMKSPSSDNGDVWKPLPDLEDGDLKRRSLSHCSENGKLDMNGQPKELRPRLCVLKKGANGYGFNLHSEKSKPGQFIRSVDPGSPAAKAGLLQQDKIVEVNGLNVEGMKHSEVVSNIKSREDETKLLVVDPETDEYFRKIGITPTEAHVRGPVPQPMSNGSAQPQVNGGSSTSSSHSDLQSPDKESERIDSERKDPFDDSGLSLSPTAAEAKEKARAKRANKRAPQMDWSKKHELFSNF
ncbi:Na(+)/H(+) exchange regulatory cofactor NHE-RF2 isoform X2 [Ambystoma mexicanum]|uniref:Na(+)/H(+) exchange regulatory cofactor NHE-RF2 isoform X2 n=1 Tax=Ambystoma mexicanum TaxID=8296 RepID=UPI0037E8B731